MAGLNKGRLATLNSYIQKEKVTSNKENQSKDTVMIFFPSKVCLNKPLFHNRDVWSQCP